MSKSARRSHAAKPKGLGEPGSKPNPNKAKTDDPREPAMVPVDESQPIPQQVVQGSDAPGGVPHRGHTHRTNAVLPRTDFTGVPDGDPEAEEPEKVRNMKVRAIKTGYYDHARRRAGDVFMIDATPRKNPTTGKTGSDFSPRWMEYVDGKTPVKVSGSQAAINRHHDGVLAGTTPKKNPAGEGDNPLDAD